MKNNHKNKVLMILGIIVIAFSVFAFLIPFSKDGVFWTAYIFEIIAILIQIPIFKIAFDNGDTIKSKFLGFPVFRVGYIYLFTQTIVSAALIIIGGFVPFPTCVAIIICTLVLSVALICSISVEAAHKEVQKIEESQKIVTSSMLELRNISSGLPSLTNDQALKAELCKLAESFKYSDPVSSDETVHSESVMKKQLNDLAVKLSDGNADINDIHEIQNKLSERNVTCMSHKK